METAAVGDSLSRSQIPKLWRNASHCIIFAQQLPLACKAGAQRQCSEAFPGSVKHVSISQEEIQSSLLCQRWEQHYYPHRLIKTLLLSCLISVVFSRALGASVDTLIYRQRNGRLNHQTPCSKYGGKSTPQYFCLAPESTPQLYTSYCLTHSSWEVPKRHLMRETSTMEMLHVWAGLCHDWKTFEALDPSPYFPDGFTMVQREETLIWDF